MLGFELFEEAMTVDNVPSLPSVVREAPYDIMTIGLKFLLPYDVKEKWTTSRGMIGAMNLGLTPQSLGAQLCNFLHAECHPDHLLAMTDD
jgi:hypothetical protein